MILALLNLFPYVGATLGLILIAAVAALHYDHYPWMMFFIVWSIQQIESNIIQPLIFNRTMNVRPLLTFVFIFISDAFFGVIGVISVSYTHLDVYKRQTERIFQEKSIFEN